MSTTAHKQHLSRITTVLLSTVWHSYANRLHIYIYTHGACQRSEQRQSLDWVTTICVSCCRVKKFIFPLNNSGMTHRDRVFFYSPHVSMVSSRIPTNNWRKVEARKAVAQVLKQCTCHPDEVPQNQTANVVHSLHCTRYQNEELDLSQSGWNAWLVLLKLENAYETPFCKISRNETGCDLAKQTLVPWFKTLENKENTQSVWS